MPFSSASRTCGSYKRPDPGVPARYRTGTPPGSPASRTESTRPAGGASALARLRRAQAAQYGRLERLAAPGDGAYAVGGRIVGFRQGDTVVTLETGYATTGNGTVLTVAQLERLARAVAARL